MFSKDKVKRLRQVNYILTHNVKLTDKGRQTLEKMRADLINEGVDPNAEVKKVKKKRVNEYGIKKGDVFVASWGHDATFHDFYEVTDVIGKKRVKVKELSKKSGEEAGSSSNSWTVRPIKHKYASDEEYIRNVLTNSNNPKKKDTYIKDKYTHSNAYYVDNPFDEDWEEDDYY